MRDDGLDNPIPLRVTVNVPTYVRNIMGRDSTYSPEAFVAAVRMSQKDVAAIDRACECIDTGITRSMFIRLAAARIAEAINAHVDAYVNTHIDEIEGKEQQDG